MLKFLGIFWRFICWWLSLFIAIKKKKPIDINQKVRDMTQIANDALDKDGVAPAPVIGPSGPIGPVTPVIPVTPNVQKRNGFIRRLIERRRNHKPTPDAGDYKVW